MYRDKERYGHDPTTVLRSKTKFKEPLEWSRKMQGSGMPDEMKAMSAFAFPGMKIFTCSWSDWFIEDADQWREEAWRIIRDTPEFQYQILTKRPERIAECLPDDWGDGYDNVWLGVSIENSAAMYRLPILHGVPCKVRWASFEPLIGEIRLVERDRRNGDLVLAGPGITDLDWAVIGGESGNETGKYRYRVCEIQWIMNLIKDCKYIDIPVFIKQLGTHLSKQMGLSDRHGGNADEWPQHLRVRQFPKTDAITNYEPSN